MKEGEIRNSETLEAEDKAVDSLAKLSSDLDSITAMTETIVKLLESNKDIFVALDGSLVLSLKVEDSVDITAIMGKKSCVVSNLEAISKQIE